MYKVYISLGSNLGDKKSNILLAIQKMQEIGISIIKASSLYKTKPIEMNSNENFINAVVLVETKCLPLQLLDGLEKIEREMGRIECKGFYEDRIIDLDILLFNDITFNTERLCIPHKKMYEREFVLKPLMEIQESINRT